MERENIIGKIGYKKTGYFAGFKGVIKQCDIEGFEHLFSIQSNHYGSVVADYDDIVIEKTE